MAFPPSIFPQSNLPTDRADALLFKSSLRDPSARLACLPPASTKCHFHIGASFIHSKMDVHEAVGTATFDVAPLAVAVADNNASNLKKNNKKTSAKTTVKKIEHLTGIGCGAWLQLPVGGASSIVSVPGSGVHLVSVGWVWHLCAVDHVITQIV